MQFFVLNDKQMRNCFLVVVRNTGHSKMCGVCFFWPTVMFCFQSGWCQALVVSNFKIIESLIIPKKIWHGLFLPYTLVKL